MDKEICWTRRVPDRRRRRLDMVPAILQPDRRRASAAGETTEDMAIIASESPSTLRPATAVSRSVARSIPRPVSREPLDRDGRADAMIAVQAIEHVLPLSGCRLRVMDLPDGARMGQLYGPSGQWLGEARCELTRQVSGWFGRSAPAGTSWALAFGAGGAYESLQVRFASLHARRIVPVVSDHYGLWVAEVAGSFRAATILATATTSTFRLHYAAA